MNAMGAYEGMKVESVVCPKPRRVGAYNDPLRPSRLSYSQHGGDENDFAAGAELLDIILAKEIKSLLGGTLDWANKNSPLFSLNEICPHCEQPHSSYKREPWLS